MDLYLIASLLGGIVIGGVIIYFLKANKKTELTEENSSPVGSSNEKQLQASIKKLESEKTDLENKLERKETLLKELSISKEGENPDSIRFKKLQEEIEDLEDEIDDLQSRNRKFQAQKEATEDELLELQRTFEKTSKEKEELTDQNQKQKSEIEANSKRLKFVNSILSAKSSDNKDFEDIKEKVKAIQEYVEENIVPFFKEEYKVLLRKDMYSWVLSELKPWIKNKKVIAIVGEFSAGKTSIVNRILSQDDPNVPLLPTNSKETTAIPTYISYGFDFNCQFYSQDQELKNIQKEIFEMVTKSVLDKTDISSLIKYFVLQYKNENLKDISILDTPGFASNSEDIIKRTTDVVRESNALFWVIDANTGDINQTSIEVMQEHLNGIPIYFVINKSDTKSDRDLGLLEEKIKDTANKNNISYQAIIRFSQKENIDVLMKHIQEIPAKEEKNTIEEIDYVLKEWIEERNKEIKEHYGYAQTQRKNINITKDNINYFKNEISDCTQAINNITNRNTGGFFGKDRYEIEVYNYEVFEEARDTIIEFISEKIPQEIKELEEYVELKIKIDNELYNLKNLRKKYEEAKKGFRKKVNDYNPELLK